MYEYYYLISMLLLWTGSHRLFTNMPVWCSDKSKFHCCCSIYLRIHLPGRLKIIHVPVTDRRIAILMSSYSWTDTDSYELMYACISISLSACKISKHFLYIARMHDVHIRTHVLSRQTEWCVSMFDLQCASSVWPQSLHMHVYVYSWSFACDHCKRVIFSTVCSFNLFIALF